MGKAKRTDAEKSLSERIAQIAGNIEKRRGRQGYIMKRNVDLNEISDGKLYGANDLVKAGCQDCQGCSACCHGMGNSIILDPLDVWRLTGGLKVSFEQLLASAVELSVVDGIILPNIRMAGEREACTFLNEEGRCSIHPHRPGICRLFPLGRVYEDGTFKYFLQTQECRKEDRVKVKVRKWIDTPDIRNYEAFVNEWHYFLKDMEAYVEGLDENEQKQVNLYLLRQFYLRPYETGEDFYPQIAVRLKEAREILK